MKKDKKKHSDCHGSVGNVEHRPPRKVVAEEIEIEEIDIDEINYSAGEEVAALEDQPVKHSVNQVADGTAENHCKSESLREALSPRLVQVIEDPDAGDDGENREKRLSTQVNTERHTRVLDVREFEEITNDWPACTES
jgi:hypothetical protein